MRVREAEAVWIYGPPGVGKSTTGWALFERLRSERRSAYIDVDQLGMCYPEPEADPNRDHLKARNAALVVRQFRAVGATRVVVSGVIDATAFAEYDEQFGSIDVAFCLLVAGDDELTRRILARGGRDDVVSALKEASELERVDLGHPVIRTDAMPVAGVVDRVSELAGWAGSGLARPDAGTGPADLTARSDAPGLAVVICGPPAVGKSTVGWDAFTRLRDSGRRTAFVDLAQISFVGGPSVGGPSVGGPSVGGPSVGGPSVGLAHHVAVANLARVWDVFAAAGAGVLVVNGPVSSTADADACRAALRNVEVIVCRLAADPSALRDRVFERSRGLGPPLAGDPLVRQPDHVLEEAARASARYGALLGASGVGDVVIDTTGRTARSVADDLHALTVSRRPA